MDILKGLMARKKISQVKLAQLMGVTQATVSRYLSGQYIPTVDSIGKLYRKGILERDEALSLLHQYGE